MENFELNELKLSSYKSAMDAGLARNDDKGREIAANALEGMAKAIGRELKGKSFIIKSSDIKKFNKAYGYDHFGDNLSRPWSGQYKMTFTGDASVLNTEHDLNTFDPSNYTISMSVDYSPANEVDGGARGDLKILGYDKYTKEGQSIQFSIRNGNVQLYDRRLLTSGGSTLQLTRKDARLMANIAKELIDAIGGESSTVKHNSIKQFSPIKESVSSMKYVKLFEGFLNEKKNKQLDQLINVLINSMEHYDEVDFVKLGNDLGMDSSTMKDIFNDYWDVDAMDRIDWDYAEWEDWLKQYKKYLLNEETRPWRSLKKQRLELKDALKSWKRNSSNPAVKNLSNMGPMVPKEPIVIPGSEIGTKIADEILITVLLKNPTPFKPTPDEPKVHYAAVTHKGEVSLWNRSISEEQYDQLVKKYGNKMYPYGDVTTQYMKDMGKLINGFMRERMGKHEW